MQAKKPTALKGTQDFNATQVSKRNYIFDTIRQIYQQYGFSPLETPALEHLSTLAGQYGPEGDQLLFKVLNSGNFLADADKEDINKGYKALLPKIAEKGLRYDLTVPLMRYVAMHSNQLTFPFKRYQIQPVWRADRPQKGRYRAFYQCDADVVGTSSLICEAEVLAMAYQVLQQLGINHFSMQLNHRAILKGIVSLIGETDKESEFCIAIDKLDKIGQDKVFEELISKGFSWDSLEELNFIFELQGTNEAKLEVLNRHLAYSKEGLKGLKEVKQVLQYVAALGLEAMPITIEPTLARGLAYYTGAVFEVRMRHISIGSIGGGGRYDNLTEHFGLSGLTGVGFSFGVDRIYAVMEALELFAQHHEIFTQVMLTNLDSESEKLALHVITQLRTKGISAEMYPEQVRLKKQLMYANKKNIPFVVIIGAEERAAGKFTLKDMHTGTQHQYTLDELMEALN